MQAILAPIPTVAKSKQREKVASCVQLGVGQRERMEIDLPAGRVECAWYRGVRTTLKLTGGLVFVSTILLWPGQSSAASHRVWLLFSDILVELSRGCLSWNTCGGIHGGLSLGC